MSTITGTPAAPSSATSAARSSGSKPGGRLPQIATAPPVGSEQGSAYRFPMPEDETQSSTLGDRLGFGASATEVDPDWLNLFRLGEPLEKASFGVTRPGERVPYGSTGTDLSRYRIGVLLLSSSGSYYLLGDE